MVKLAQDCTESGWSRREKRRNGGPPSLLALGGTTIQACLFTKSRPGNCLTMSKGISEREQSFFFFSFRFFFFRSVGIGGILGCATRKKHSIFLSCHVWTAIKTKASDWLCVQCLCKHYNGYKTSDKRRPDANKITHSLDQLYDSITTAILVLCAL